MVLPGDDKEKINSEANADGTRIHREICMERFDNIDRLHKQRSAEHNASTGV